MSGSILGPLPRPLLKLFLALFGNPLGTRNSPKCAKMRPEGPSGAPRSEKEPCRTNVIFLWKSNTFCSSRRPRWLGNRPERCPKRPKNLPRTLKNKFKNGPASEPVLNLFWSNFGVRMGSRTRLGKATYRLARIVPCKNIVITGFL